MVLNLVQKKELVADLKETVNKSESMIVALYRGLNVAQITAMRKQGRENGVHIQVVRNTLARIAVKDTKYSGMSEYLQGPVILAFSADDPGAAARLLSEYVKKSDILKVKALGLGETVLEANQLNVVANLPTYEEAIALLMSGMQSSITAFSGSLQNVYGKLAAMLHAVAEQKSE